MTDIFSPNWDQITKARNAWFASVRKAAESQKALGARSVSPSARIATQIVSQFRWRCGCGTEITHEDLSAAIGAALDHADNCIESDHNHKGEAQP